MAHSGWRGDAGGRAVGLGMDDLWRPRVLEHGCDLGRDRRLGPHRPCTGNAPVQAAGEIHGCALGYDDLSAHVEQMRSTQRTLITLVLVAGAYEGVAHSGAFPSALLPSLEAVVRALVRGILDGTLLV